MVVSFVCLKKTTKVTAADKKMSRTLTREQIIVIRENVMFN